MQKIRIAGLLAIWTLSLAAQKTVSPATGKAKSPAALLENTLLWEVSGAHVRTSYLFGTMHLLCAEDAQLSDSLRFAIGKVQQVYFEINLGDIKETLGALRYLNMNDDTRLSDLLTEEAYQRVKDYFRKNKTLLPFSMMERMKPYFIASLIAESRFPCPAKDGMEQQIMKEARKDNKAIYGLETVQFQASVFDSIPYKRQAYELVRMIDNSGNGADSTDLQLMELYRRQDLNRMQELTANEEGMQEYLDLLLYNRNASWVRKMPAIMKNAPALFAVGAGHLGGEKGVIALLRKAGFTVRPMLHQPGLETLSN